jgi:glucose/arabinose dehydrogenase
MIPMIRCCLCLVLLPCIAIAADAPKPATKPSQGLDMDYGSFLAYSVLKPQSPKVPGAKPAEKHQLGDPLPPWKAGELLATKGITVKLAHDAAICFDIDTCRYAAGWVGGFLDVSQCNLTRNQGPWPAIAKGTLVFTTQDGPGWAKDGLFKDPRKPNSDRRMKNGEGPLPRDWAHYRGMYRDGEKVVFEYTVGEVRILDMPGLMVEGGRTVLTRTLRLDPHTAPLKMQVCAVEGGVTGGAGDSKGRSAAVWHEDQAVGVSIVGGPPGVALLGGSGASDASRIELSIAPNAQPAQIKIVLASASNKVADKLLQFLESIKQDAKDLTTHTKGGPALWKDDIETKGNVASNTAAYVIDTVSLPDKNPWKSWMKPTGFDFFPDGRAAVATMNGDVWIVSGLDAKLDHVKWKRFATGLYEPLGVKIVDGQIYVLDRSGIVRLHDLNNDGEADFYENFNSDLVSDANYHSFHLDLQTDREGNFYYAVCGNQMALAKPDHSCVVKVSKYGDKAEILCLGLRASNGLGMGPNDELTVGDNQGHWVPASPIFLAKAGAFFGYHGDSRRVSKEEMIEHAAQHPTNDPPICWVPYPWDNSAGGQVWAGNNWGPLSGHMLHTSYGKCTIFEVMTEQIDGVMQGGVVLIPGKFDSGVMRGRVSPADGQVWLCGMSGWQTSANKAGCFQRLRYTGKPSYLPTETHMTTQGVRVTFPIDLDPETANDEGGYSFEVWGYHVSDKYGSDEFKVSDPNVKGHDMMEVKKAILQPDKRSVLIEVDGLKPVTQYILKMRLKAADGTNIKCDVGGSIWVLGK